MQKMCAEVDAHMDVRDSMCDWALMGRFSRITVSIFEFNDKSYFVFLSNYLVIWYCYIKINNGTIVHLIFGQA